MMLWLDGKRREPEDQPAELWRPEDWDDGPQVGVVLAVAVTVLLAGLVLGWLVWEVCR